MSEDRTLKPIIIILSWGGKMMRENDGKNEFNQGKTQNETLVQLMYTKKKFFF
jgi:hypothetical protein